MDWSKIKSILIVALVLANLALSYEIFYQKSLKEDQSFSRSFQKKTLALLEDKGISLAPEVKLKKEKLNSLRVEYESIPEEEMNEIFFNNEALMTQPGLDLVKLTLGRESLSIYNERRLYYQSGKELSGEKINKDRAEELALNFLRDREISTEDLKLVKTTSWHRGYRLAYKKLYKNVLVETTYTNIYVDKNGVHYMERMWLNVLKASDHFMPLESPSKALLSLLDREELGPAKVVDLSPCYYFNPQKQGYIEDITKAQQGRAIPAWRIQLDSGEDVIVDILS